MSTEAKNWRIYPALCVTLLLIAGCKPAVDPTASTAPAEEPGSPEQASAYLGQRPPGETPVAFAPGVVNTVGIELNGVVSPDGGEFFFTRVDRGVATMHRSLAKSNGNWTKPEPVYAYPDKAPALAVDMAYTPDGSRLYLLGQYSEELKENETDANIFYMDRQPDGSWSFATPLPAPVNTEHSESYPSVVADGSIYFSSDRPGGQGKTDIWRAQLQEDGSFAEPVNVGPPVNTEHLEGDTYVSPDESWLVVTSRRPDSLNGDLYVYFREDDGSWGDAQRLPEPINSELLDYCPMGTPDGKYFFFSRRTGETWAEANAGDVFWVSMSVIERMRPR